MLVLIALRERALHARHQSKLEWQRMNFEWEKVRADFEPDGSLRDIYVFGTTLADWSVLMTLALETDRAAELTVEGDRLPSPQPSAAWFGGASGPLLRFRAGRVTLACHFFTDTQIELDFQPGEVCDRDALRALLSFVAELSRRTAKPAHICHENAPGRPIVSCDGGKWVFQPPDLGG